ncbi:cytochrome c oxidase subunit CcoN [Vibrio maritimus]|uniref:Cytochrome c oxidase subunit CcoN n=1 Tax=Vibrio maritimus TaxID=990268 RepID=A0A090SVH2_9VIBR|nr:cytochrome c oxidase subunit CcoN [Vibrio maritimus]
MDITANHYDTKVVRYFILASLIWAVAGMVIGVILLLSFTGQYSTLTLSIFNLGGSDRFTPLELYTDLSSTY